MTTTKDKEGNDVGTLNNTFWLDGYEGECNSGFFIRSDLFKKVAHFEELGHKVVGIKIEPDSWNLEFICEKEKVE